MKPRPKQQERDTQKEKICIYLGDLASEIDEAAAKLNESRSRLLVRAWYIARDRIAKLPGAEVT